MEQHLVSRVSLWITRITLVTLVVIASIVAGAQLREARESAAARPTATASAVPTTGASVSVATPSVVPPGGTTVPGAMTAVPSPIATVRVSIPPPTPTPEPTKFWQSLPTPTPSPVRAAGVISGRVTAGGQPVKDAEVRAYPADTAIGNTPVPPAAGMSTSGADGIFRMSLPGGRYRVGAWLPDQSSLAPTYWRATWYGGAHAIGLGKDVAVSGDAAGIDLPFIRSPLVSGRVVAPDGVGIPGALVTASVTVGVGYDLGSARSDASGAFSFHTVPLGMTVMAVTQGRTEPVFSTMDLDVRTDLTGLRFVLSRGNLITGTLRDASGKALANTNFGADTGQVCCGQSTDTDALGHFTLVLPDAATTFHTWPRYPTEPMLYSKEYTLTSDASLDIVVTTRP